MQSKDGSSVVVGADDKLFCVQCAKNHCRALQPSLATNLLQINLSIRGHLPIMNTLSSAILRTKRLRSGGSQREILEGIVRSGLSSLATVSDLDEAVDNTGISTGPRPLEHHPDTEG